MPPHRIPGSVNQHDRPVPPDAGTSCVGTSPCVRSLGTEHPELAGMALSPEAAAFRALQYVEESIQAQDVTIEVNGFGIFYGDQSSFAKHPKSQEQKLRKMWKGGGELKAIPYPRAINCVELLFEAMTVYRDVQLKAWSSLIAKARDSRSLGKDAVVSGRGTVLLEEARRSDGFITWYYSRDTSEDKFYPGVKKHLFGPPSGHVVVGADSHQKMDVGVHISNASNFAVDFAKNPAQLEALNKVPFALGAADWGTHTFIFSYGHIYEDHWTQGPNQKVFEKKSFLEFSKEWPAGVIAAAPGNW